MVHKLPALSVVAARFCNGRPGQSFALATDASPTFLPVTLILTFGPIHVTSSGQEADKYDIHSEQRWSPEGE